MSKWQRHGELGRAFSCIALMGIAACTSAGVVKLSGSVRIVTTVTMPDSAEVELSRECAALLDAAPAASPTFADSPVPTSCDALGRALEPELVTRMTSVLERIRDEYLVAGCQGAEPGQRGPRTVSLVQASSWSLTERWSSRANGEPAMAQTIGQFLYVAAHGTLQALNLSRPNAPRVVGRAALDGVRTQVLVHGRRLLAIARRHADARPAYCEPGTACDFAEDRGTLLSLFEIDDRARPRLIEQLALSGDFAYGALVGSIAHLVTDDTASNQLGLRFEPNSPAAGAPAVRRAMAELHAANSLQIARAEPAARLPSISRRAGSGSFVPFEPTCRAYTVTHGAELQSILSFDLETGSLARTLLEAPFGRAALVLGELALEPPRPNPSRDAQIQAYRFSLSRAPATLAPSGPTRAALPVVGGHVEIPLDSRHTLAFLRDEPSLINIDGAITLNSALRVRLLGGEEPGAALPIPEARVVPPGDPFAWSAQDFSFGYFPLQRLLAVASDPFVPTTDIAQQSPSSLSLFAVSTRAVTPLAVIQHAPFALPRTDDPRPEAVFVERGLLFDVTEEALYVWNPAKPNVAVTRVPLSAAP